MTVRNAKMKDYNKCHFEYTILPIVDNDEIREKKYNKLKK